MAPDRRCFLGKAAASRLQSERREVRKMVTPTGLLALQVLLLALTLAGYFAESHARRVEAMRRTKIRARLVIEHPPAYSRHWMTHTFAHRRSLPTRLRVAA
jgi:hypothetical protein